MRCCPLHAPKHDSSRLQDRLADHNLDPAVLTAKEQVRATPWQNQPTANRRLKLMMVPRGIMFRRSEVERFACSCFCKHCGIWEPPCNSNMFQFVGSSVQHAQQHRHHQFSFHAVPRGIIALSSFVLPSHSQCSPRCFSQALLQAVLPLLERALLEAGPAAGPAAFKVQTCGRSVVAAICCC